MNFENKKQNEMEYVKRIVVRAQTHIYKKSARQTQWAKQTTNNTQYSCIRTGQ